MGLLGSLGGILGGIAGNALLPGIGGALGSALGGALGGSAGGGSGGGGSSASTTAGSGGYGSTSGGSNNAYIPANRPGVDQNFLGNKDQYQSTLGQQQGAIAPYNQQLLQSQFNNPYVSGAQTGANAAQEAYYNNANQAYGLSQGNYAYAQQQMQNAQQQQQLYQQGLGNVQQSTGNLYGGGNQILQTALDPQNALYNRTAQQLTDQTRAAQYARGIQSSPLGASVESNALGNFNIDWQNQQLARQAQGLQSAAGAYGAAGNQYTGYLGAINQSNAQNTSNISGAQQNAFGLGQQAAGSYQSGGQVPYQTNQNIYGNQNQGLQNYLGNNQSYLSGLNQLQSNDLAYLNYGTGAQNLGFQQSQTNLQNQGQATAALGSAIGNTNWGNVGNTISGWFGGGSSSNPNQPPANYNWGSDILSAYG